MAKIINIPPTDATLYTVDTEAFLTPISGVVLDDGRYIKFSPDADPTHYVEIKAADTMTSSYVLKLPVGNGTNGQALKLVNGTLEWYTPFTSAAFDAYKVGLPMKNAAAAASTVNIDITAGNPGTIDGVDFTFGGLVLLKNQTDPSENGLWVLDIAGFNSRDVTMPDNFSSAYAAIVPVGAGGTVNGNTIWFSQANGYDGDVPFVKIF